MVYILGTLGQDNAKVNTLVLNAFRVLGALEERHLEDIAITSLQLPQVRSKVAIPTNPEAIVPAAENGVARTDLKVGLARIGPEAASGDVSNVIGEVGINGAGLERHLKLAKRRGRRLRVNRHLPLHTGEVVLQRSATVRQPVAFLSGQVTTPLADFDIALQTAGMRQGLGVLIAHADGLLGTGGNLVVGTVGKAGSLLGGVLSIVCIRRGQHGVVGNIGIGELELRLLLQGDVGRGCVSAEAVLDILLLALVNGCGKRLKGG